MASIRTASDETRKIILESADDAQIAAGMNDSMQNGAMYTQKVENHADVENGRTDRHIYNDPVDPTAASSADAPGDVRKVGQHINLGSVKIELSTALNVLAIVAVASAIITAGVLGYITLAVRWVLEWVPHAGIVGVIGLIAAQVRQVMEPKSAVLSSA